MEPVQRTKGFVLPDVTAYADPVLRVFDEIAGRQPHVAFWGGPHIRCDRLQDFAELAASLIRHKRSRTTSVRDGFVAQVDSRWENDRGGRYKKASRMPRPLDTSSKGAREYLIDKLDDNYESLIYWAIIGPMKEYCAGTLIYGHVHKRVEYSYSFRLLVRAAAHLLNCYRE
jgi:hypothetical protein